MTSDKLTVNELFSGIGAQRKALERLGIDHEVVGICEIDKYAIQSYEAIFGKTKNYGDICTAPRLDYADLWTYSFPCQDISVAGKQQGISENTRSGLLYQVQRLLEVAKEEGTLPKYLLLENVKNLVGKQFKSQFEDWLFYLDELGYDSYWQVLNAKNYGMPQNRERVFAISIRKDLNKTFEFPQIEELKIRLKDVLENEVEDKFYLSQEYFERFIKSLDSDKYPMGNEYKVLGTTKAETERMGTNSRHWVYDTNSCMSTLDATMYKQPKQILVAIKEATKKGYAEATIGDSINIEQPNSKTRRGRVGHGVAQTLTTAPHQVVIENSNPVRLGNIYGEDKGTGFAGNVWDKNAISLALMTMQGGNRQPMVIKDLRIRKLTPLECWRLMGFDDEDFKKAQQSGVSNSQLYKQAGNSIVVNVLEKIFKNLF